MSGPLVSVPNVYHDWKVYHNNQLILFPSAINDKIHYYKIHNSADSSSVSLSVFGFVKNKDEEL